MLEIETITNQNQFRRPQVQKDREEWEKIRKDVLDIIEQVQEEGDRALIDLTEKFDGVRLRPEELRVSREEIQGAKSSLDQKILSALKKARDNIFDFHSRQKRDSWSTCVRDGVLIGQKVTPIDRIGIYIPGGKAVYPSTILMIAVPARVAGVGEIAMCTPPGPQGALHPLILAVADMMDIGEIYRVGGAQAIAALALGTETISRVDKIFGPGNRYVEAAKRELFGVVGIDLLAGPSEVVILSDETGNATLIAADMIAQAEHDPDAISIVVTPVEELALGVRAEVERLATLAKRRDIIVSSLEKNARLVVVPSLREALKLVNDIAPEHVELMVRDPLQMVEHICHAGAIFLGQSTPVAVGDYIGGTNHVLPTGGSARFSSCLGVDDFMKRSSILGYGPQNLEEDGEDILSLAMAEGLFAHAESVSLRLKGLARKDIPEKDRRT
ncbi:histidinol dehydrogenase [Candidatus Hakubella thermalkaliphila]|uniref:Histidinol dehydrogenase n=1 Tax=Candidatus Hakubella thermalkaliphila TaxID=2754717 RepID=A0A6V8PB72_9ACTN|nr:histidinol dehydrogenase [Candidatus Hakubella thermalkaliphila]GFP29935.1 histidinol dehydrogenase [Candidatus Hakubella thermalkaliphila]